MTDNDLSVFELAHKLHNLLRNQEGIIGEKALYEINLGFTIRLIEPLIGKNKLLKLPEFCKFSNLMKDKKNMFDNYKNIGKEFQKNNILKQFNYKNTLITNDDTCQEFLNLINNIQIDDEDVKGKIWEYFIGRDKDTISDLGQYFTSNRIVKYCINLINPTLDDTILDPTCGSGGFLSNCAMYLNKKYDDIKWSEQKNNFTGYDIASDVVKLGLVNMLICTGELFTNQIKRKDTFRESIGQKYDIILANPPYGGDKKSKNNKNDNKIGYSDACREIKDFGVPSNVKELLFLQMIMSNLKEGGRACVVLPEGLFSNIQDKSFMETRKILVEDYNVKEIGFASNEFENTSVNTCVLFFEKTGKTDKIKFSNILNGQHLMTVDYKDIIETNYVLSHKLHYVLSLVKPIDGYDVSRLADIIKIEQRTKNNASDGLIQGDYRFYTNSNGSYQFINTPFYKNMTIICSESFQSKLNMDNNYSCTKHFHNFSSKIKKISTEYVYYYLKQNIFLIDMLYIGTIIPNLNRFFLSSLKIHVPKDTKKMEIIKRCHDKIQKYKETQHSRTMETEQKIDELKIIKNIKVVPLYRENKQPFADEKDDICEKAYELHNLLRNEEGIIGERALQEISFIFTIRSLEQLIDNKRVNLPDFCRWTVFSNMLNDSNRLFDTYKNIHTELWNNGIYDKKTIDFRETHINKAKTLEKMIRLVKEINFDENEDLKGKIYEAFVGRDKKNIKDLGQYFTNHRLVSYCINLVKPTLDCTILDPTCGSGGFLVNCAVYLNKNNDSVDWSVVKNNFRGYDIAKDVIGISIINLLLSTGELFKEQILRMDTLYNNMEEKYDIILANPPYGGDRGNKKTGGTATNYKRVCEKNKNIEEFDVVSNIKELLFTQMIMTRLKPNGRCCIILPEGLFFKGNKDFYETRKKMVEEYNIIEIGYASNEFENTSVNTCIVYFKNDGKKTKKILFRDIKTGKEIISVKYDDIVINDYVLVYNAYIVQKYKEIKGYDVVKLSDCIEFIKLKKRNAEYGLEEGKYRFYTCSVGTRLFCNERDCKERAIIIATGGSPKISIDGNFSASADNFAFKSSDNNILTEWIYYYLHNNMHLLEYLFMGTVLKHINKTFFSNIVIHVPPLDDQKNIKEMYDNMFTMNTKYNDLIKSIEHKIMTMDVLTKVKLENPLEQMDQKQPDIVLEETRVDIVDTETDVNTYDIVKVDEDDMKIVNIVDDKKVKVKSKSKSNKTRDMKKVIREKSN